MLLAACTIVAGCAAREARSPAPVTAAASGIAWTALAASWPGAPEHRVDLVSFIDGRTGDRHDFRFDTQLSAGHLVMVAQTPLGVPLYRMSVTPEAVDTAYYDERFRRMPLDGVLADFVLAHWPIEVLAATARSAGYNVTEEGDRRQLVDAGGQPLVEIEFKVRGGSVISVSHFDIPLVVLIRSIDQEP